MDRLVHNKQRDFLRWSCAMLAAIAEERRPADLLPGSDALKRVRDTLSALNDGVDAWQTVKLSTEGKDRRRQTRGT
jgi:hypothetical protein